MLVEEQMELIEGRARDLPVMLLVEIAQREGVGQHLVQILHSFRTGLFGQGNGHPDETAERLNLVRLLVCQRSGVSHDGIGSQGLHLDIPPCSYPVSQEGLACTERLSRASS